MSEATHHTSRKGETYMKLEITLTAAQIATFNKLKTTRANKTDAELFAQVVERGIYDLSYRSERNKKVYAQFKQFKASQKSGN